MLAPVILLICSFGVRLFGQGLAKVIVARMTDIEKVYYLMKRGSNDGLIASGLLIMLGSLGSFVSLIWLAIVQFS